MNTDTEAETVETIRRVWIDGKPWHLTWGEFGQELGDWRDEYANLPKPFLDALDALGNRPDELTCAMCRSAAVGFSLRENDDEPMSGGLDWVDTYLVQFDGEHEPVYAVCVNCAGPDRDILREAPPLAAL